MERGRAARRVARTGVLSVSRKSPSASFALKKPTKEDTIPKFRNGSLTQEAAPVWQSSSLSGLAGDQGVAFPYEAVNCETQEGLWSALRLWQPTRPTLTANSASRDRIDALVDSAVHAWW